MRKTKLLRVLSPILLALLAGCGGDVGETAEQLIAGDDEDNPNEVMTTLTLTFTAASSSETLTASWADPELDGAPLIDDIILAEGETYAVILEVFNELEDPTEDVTPEIRDEMDEHQVFFTGSAVVGPCNTGNPDAVIEHTYEDEDNNGFPIGLSNAFFAQAAGSGVLNVLLRHMPEVNGSAVKTGDLATVMDTNGAPSLPGSTDINVSFAVTIE